LKHIIAKVDPIVGFLFPTYTKKQLMRFFGMIDLYSIFCFNYGTVVHPRVSLVEQELITLPEHMSSPRVLVALVLLDP